MGESDGMSSWIDPSPTFTFTIFPGMETCTNMVDVMWLAASHLEG